MSRRVSDAPIPGKRHKETTKTRWKDSFKKGKGSFYIAQYPVRWTAQSALHLLPPLFNSLKEGLKKEDLTDRAKLKREVRNDSGITK